MPSPSLSSEVLGQPSVGRLPLPSSFSLGQASLRSGMPSPSLSGSGQPSSSWKPSLSSGSLGHLSSASGMPSPSLSRSGQPSSSWKPSLSSGSLGHLSTSSGMPSPSLSGRTLGPLSDSLVVVDVDPLDFAEVQVHAAEDLEVRAGVADAIAMGDNGQRGPRHGNAPVEADAHHGRKADLEANAGVHERLGASASLGRVADERRQPTISSEQEGLEPVVVVQIQNETAPVGEDVHLRAEIAEVRLVVAGSGRYDGELSLEADPAVEVQAEFPAEHARARGRPGRRISHGPP